MRWHDADGVGLATGKTNGIDVLDVDIRQSQEVQGSPSSSVEGRDGFAVVAQLGPLPSTLAAQTPRDGRHFYFRHVEGSRSRKLCADGSVEWFSDRKLVVVPPAPGRHWICEAEIAEAPDWLRELVLTSPHHTHTHDAGPFPGLLVSGAGSSSSVPKPIYSLILHLMPDATRQQQRWARSLWKLVANKTEGRNDGLNYAAFNFRKLIAERAINASGACQLLLSAAATNGYLAKDGEAATQATIMSGLGIKDWQWLPPTEVRPKQQRSN
jgi:hypothetical protein